MICKDTHKFYPAYVFTIICIYSIILFIYLCQLIVDENQ